ncbi:gliding motility lipoprotein GldD [Flavisericum labens]|uniref:gliding motility lipoprotein GldD n=1 Tax=Flavisericum labens TaxID=3377112 RepID=UPI00387AA8D3
MTIKIRDIFSTKNFLIVMALMVVSCGDNYVPKPKGHLRLDYPDTKYADVDFDLPFSCEVNKLAKNIEVKQIEASSKSYGINLEYPLLKGTIFLTYKSVEKSDKNLRDFIRDAQNLTQKHTIKADEIPVTVYENKKRNVFGAFAEVKGNVASMAQFYITDSVNHFLTGSLYFYAKPNYDSILPAAHYLQNDMKHIMETVKWK